MSNARTSNQKLNASRETILKSMDWRDFFYIKATALITAVAFLFTTISVDLARAADHSIEPTGVGSIGAGSSGISRELDVETFALPVGLGSVKEAWASRGTMDEGRKRIIIHIQDAHCNYNAQHKIAEIVEYLNTEYGIKTINLEGGKDDYDLSLFTGIRDAKIREKVTDHFVKEGLVNGAEYFAINNPDKVMLWGVEDVDIYIENLKVYRDSLKYKDIVDKHLKVLEHILANLKRHIYSGELYEFDEKYALYQDKKLELKDYLDFIIKAAESKNVGIDELKNVSLLKEALRREGEIDFKKANNQRDEFIDLLQKMLSTREVEKLVVKTVEFKKELISQAEFYGYLEGRAKMLNLGLGEYPELQKYIAYISMYDSMDKPAAMKEIGLLEDRIKEAMYRNDAERELNGLSRNLAVAKNIFNITLIRDDYTYYKGHEDAFSVRNYVSFINKYAPLYKVSAALGEDIEELDNYREKLVKFYEYSFGRDGAFLANMGLEETRNQSTEYRTKPVVLVTGGFHTENLLQLFKQNGISYISIMPNFKNGDDSECPYFKLLAGEKSLDIKGALPAVLENAMAIPDPLNDTITIAVNANGLGAFVPEIGSRVKGQGSRVQGPGASKDELVKPAKKDKDSTTIKRMLILAPLAAAIAWLVSGALTAKTAVEAAVVDEVTSAVVQSAPWISGLPWELVAAGAILVIIAVWLAYRYVVSTRGQGAREAVPAPAPVAELATAGQELSPPTAMTRQYLIADKLGIPYDEMPSWMNANPEKAAVINKQLDEMAKTDQDMRVFLRMVDSKYAVIGRDNPRFAGLYAETEEIVKRLLGASGFNADNFNLYLLDSTDQNAFIVNYGNSVFVNIGLIKFIVENGGSKDALAFVLAHEIRHIDQWVSDCVQGKPIERGLGALLSMHADEYDADNALALIDKAGYSVRDAGFFFSRFLERSAGQRRISLGFLTHPPTVERLRKIERDIMKFFWLHFFNKTERFSAASVRELGNRSEHRMFQESVARCGDRADFTGLADARTPEEFIFALMVAHIRWDTDIGSAYDRFLEKFNITDTARRDFYRIVFDIIRLDAGELARQRGSPYRVRGNLGGMANYSVNELEARLSLRSIAELKALFSVELPGPVQFDSYDLSINVPYDFDYSGFAGSICYVLGERVKSLYASGDITDVDELLDLMTAFQKRYAEAHMYTATALSSDVQNGLETMLQTLLRILNNYAKDGNIIAYEHMESLLNFVDTLARQANYSTGEKATMLLCELMKNAAPANKDAILKWLIRNNAEKASRFRDYFFEHMARDRELTDALPGMGQGAESDLDILFSNPYFAKHSLFSRVRLGSPTGSTWEVDILSRFLQNLSEKYSLSPENKLSLYERAMVRLRLMPIEEEGKVDGRLVTRLYRIMYEEMGRIDAIDGRIGLDDSMPADLHPEVKKLLYFYKQGGVLSFRDIRGVFYTITARATRQRDPEAPFTERDMEAFLGLLVSRAGEIKGRFEEKEKAEKELRWNKYILPFSLFAAFDGQALDEDASQYESTRFRQVGLADGTTVTEASRPTRFGRFTGEFESLYRYRGMEDYYRTRVSRGRGINRIYLAGETAQALLDIFGYITDSGKNFESLLNDITAALPATSYRNFALYILFVEKILKGECGIRIGADEMFDLDHVQRVIAGLGGRERARAMGSLGRLNALMTEDTEMKYLNQPGPTDMGKLNDGDRQAIELAHAAGEGGYYPAEYTELGGPLSQLDIFVGLLAEGLVMETIRFPDTPFDQKLKAITDRFPRSSNTRDRFVAVLLEEAAGASSSADIEKALPLLNSDNLRERHAVRALEKKRAEDPTEFRTADGELKWVLHYFPEFSLTRDDTLLQLIDEKAVTPGDVQKIRSYLVRAPENVREGARARLVFGSSLFNEYLNSRNAHEKSEFLLWVAGMSDKKPFFVKRFEHRYDVSLNGLRDAFLGRRAGYYKNVGDSVMEEFLERMLVGGNGIFYDQGASDAFLDAIFDNVMPSQRAGMMKVLYDAVFRKSGVDRKYNIVFALMRNFAREQGSAEGVNEDRAIRIFLESLGLIGAKMGQFLSTYEDVPEKTRNELKLLKDRATPISKEVVFDMISKIYGSFEQGPINEILECIGSASIKTVYRARLKDGREIVIKVKRPEVEKKMEEDLGFLRDILSDEEVEKALKANNIEVPKQLGERVAEMIREEMDLRGEAENQARLRAGIGPGQPFRKRLVNRIFRRFISKMFRAPAGSYSFEVPITHDVQNNTLIIEEFVKGRRLGADNADQMAAVARELMRQIFVDGFYHADPHTGNIFVTGSGNKIYFIDVGSASEISLKNRYLLYWLMAALESGNGANVAGIVKKIAGKDISLLDKKADDIASSKEDVVRKALMVFKLLEDSGVTIDKQLISVFRCFGQGYPLLRVALGIAQTAPAPVTKSGALAARGTSLHILAAEKGAAKKTPGSQLIKTLILALPAAAIAWLISGALTAKTAVEAAVVDGAAEVAVQGAQVLAWGWIAAGVVIAIAVAAAVVYLWRRAGAAPFVSGGDVIISGSGTIRVVKEVKGNMITLIRPEIDEDGTINVSTIEYRTLDKLKEHVEKNEVRIERRDSPSARAFDKKIVDASSEELHDFMLSEMSFTLVNGHTAMIAPLCVDKNGQIVWIGKRAVAGEEEKGLSLLHLIVYLSKKEKAVERFAIPIVSGLSKKARTNLMVAVSLYAADKIKIPAEPRTPAQKTPLKSLILALPAAGIAYLASGALTAKTTVEAAVLDEVANVAAQGAQVLPMGWVALVAAGVIFAVVMTALIVAVGIKVYERWKRIKAAKTLLKAEAPWAKTDYGDLIEEALGILGRREEIIRDMEVMGIQFRRGPPVEGTENIVFIEEDPYQIALQIYNILEISHPWNVSAQPEYKPESEDLREKISKEPLKVVEDLRNFTDDETLSLDDLTGEVRLDFHESSSHKIVFKASFAKRDGAELCSAFPCAFKKERIKKGITLRETGDLELLQIARPRLDFIPKLGNIFRDDEGNPIAYMEEFIPGKTAWEVLKGNENDLTLEQRKKIVEAILRTGFELNAIPRDIHGRNFVIDEERDRVVFVDIGDRRIPLSNLWTRRSEALRLVSLLVGYYGYPDGTDDTLNDFIFEMVKNILDNEMVALRLAYYYALTMPIKEKESYGQVDIQDIDCPHKSWIKTSKNFEVLRNQLGAYLEKKQLELASKPDKASGPSSGSIKRMLILALPAAAIAWLVSGALTAKTAVEAAVLDEVTSAVVQSAQGVSAGTRGLLIVTGLIAAITAVYLWRMATADKQSGKGRVVTESAARTSDIGKRPPYITLGRAVMAAAIGAKSFMPSLPVEAKIKKSDIPKASKDAAMGARASGERIESVDKVLRLFSEQEWPKDEKRDGITREIHDWLTDTKEGRKYLYHVIEMATKAGVEPSVFFDIMAVESAARITGSGKNVFEITDAFIKDWNKRIRDAGKGERWARELMITKFAEEFGFENGIDANKVKTDSEYTAKVMAFMLKADIRRLSLVFSEKGIGFKHLVNAACLSHNAGVDKVIDAIEDVAAAHKDKVFEFKEVVSALLKKVDKAKKKEIENYLDRAYQHNEEFWALNFEEVSGATANPYFYGIETDVIKAWFDLGEDAGPKELYNAIMQIEGRSDEFRQAKEEALKVLLARIEARDTANAEWIAAKIKEISSFSELQAFVSAYSAEIRQIDYEMALPGLLAAYLAFSVISRGIDRVSAEGRGFDETIAGFDIGMTEWFMGGNPDRANKFLEEAFLALLELESKFTALADSQKEALKAVFAVWENRNSIKSTISSQQLVLINWTHNSKLMDLGKLILATYEIYKHRREMKPFKHLGSLLEARLAILIACVKAIAFGDVSGYEKALKVFAENIGPIEYINGALEEGMGAAYSQQFHTLAGRAFAILHEPYHIAVYAWYHLGELWNDASFRKDFIKRALESIRTGTFRLPKVETNRPVARAIAMAPIKGQPVTILTLTTLTSLIWILRSLGIYLDTFGLTPLIIASAIFIGIALFTAIDLYINYNYVGIKKSDRQQAEDLKETGPQISLEVLKDVTGNGEGASAAAIAFDQVDANFDEWMRSGQMSPDDLELLKQILLGDEEILKKLLNEHPAKAAIKFSEEMSPDGEGRTVYLTLDKPFPSSNGDITILRIKGARPRGGDDPASTGSYRGRSGFNWIPLRVNSRGNLFRKPLILRDNDGKLEWNPLDLDPQGALLASDADREYQLMKAGIAGYGFETDYPIACGSWKQKRHAGRPIGFVIAGMRSEDVRINIPWTNIDPDKLLISMVADKVLKTDPAMCAEIYAALGRSIRAYHDAGYFHGNPHNRNWGVEIGLDGKVRVIIRDLDPTVRWNEISGRDLQRSEAAYRLMDLQRIVADLSRAGDTFDEFLYYKRLENSDNARKMYDMPIARIHKEAIKIIQPFAESFLMGYFPEISPDSEEFRGMAADAVSEDFARMYRDMESSGKSLVLGQDAPAVGNIWKHLHDLSDRGTSLHTLAGRAFAWLHEPYHIIAYLYYHPEAIWTSSFWKNALSSFRTGTFRLPKVETDRRAARNIAIAPIYGQIRAISILAIATSAMWILRSVGIYFDTWGYTSIIIITAAIITFAILTAIDLYINYNYVGIKKSDRQQAEDLKETGPQISLAVVNDVTGDGKDADMASFADQVIEEFYMGKFYTDLARNKMTDGRIRMSLKEKERIEAELKTANEKNRQTIREIAQIEGQIADIDERLKEGISVNEKRSLAAARNGLEGALIAAEKRNHEAYDKITELEIIKGEIGIILDDLNYRPETSTGFTVKLIAFFAVLTAMGGAFGDSGIVGAVWQGLDWKWAFVIGLGIAAIAAFLFIPPTVRRDIDKGLDVMPNNIIKLDDARKALQADLPDNIRIRVDELVADMRKAAPRAKWNHVVVMLFAVGLRIQDLEDGGGILTVGDMMKSLKLVFQMSDRNVCEAEIEAYSNSLEFRNSLIAFIKFMFLDSEYAITKEQRKDIMLYLKQTSGRHEFTGAEGRVTTGNLEELGSPADEVIRALDQKAFTLPFMMEGDEIGKVYEGLVDINGIAIEVCELRDVLFAEVRLIDGKPVIFVNKDNINELLNMINMGSFEKKSSIKAFLIKTGLPRDISVGIVENFGKASGLTPDEKKAFVARIFLHELAEAYALQKGFNEAEAHTAAMMAELYAGNSDSIRAALAPVLAARDLRQYRQVGDSLGFAGDAKGALPDEAGIAEFFGTLANLSREEKNELINEERERVLGQLNEADEEMKKIESEIKEIREGIAFVEKETGETRGDEYEQLVDAEREAQQRADDINKRITAWQTYIRALEGALTELSGQDSGGKESDVSGKLQNIEGLRSKLTLIGEEIANLDLDVTLREQELFAKQHSKSTAPETYSLVNERALDEVPETDSTYDTEPEELYSAGRDSKLERLKIDLDNKKIERDNILAKINNLEAEVSGLERKKKSGAADSGLKMGGGEGGHTIRKFAETANVGKLVEKAWGMRHDGLSGQIQIIRETLRERDLAMLREFDTLFTIDETDEARTEEQAEAPAANEADARRAAIVEAFNSVEKRTDIVKVVVCVQAGTTADRIADLSDIQKAVYNGINDTLAAMGLGRIGDYASCSASPDEKQVFLCEINEADGRAAVENLKKTIDDAERHTNGAVGRIVVFAPEIEGVLELASKDQKARYTEGKENVTVIADAYTDSKLNTKSGKGYPDIFVRVAIARHVAFYLECSKHPGDEAETKAHTAINNILSQVSGKTVNSINEFLSSLLEIWSVVKNIQEWIVMIKETAKCL